MVAYNCNPSTEEANGGGLLWTEAAWADLSLGSAWVSNRPALKTNQPTSKQGK